MYNDCRVTYFLLLLIVSGTAHSAEDFILVSAEGLADSAYYKSQRVAYDEAIKDAKRQILDKAVGSFVDSSTLVKNYQTISDTVHSRHQGFINNVVKIVDGGNEPDGFYHVWIKAEVSTKPLSDAVSQFSTMNRKSLIRQHNNPTFATDISIHPIGGKYGKPFRCDSCEVEISNRLFDFGYRLIEHRRAREDLRNRQELIQLELGDKAAMRYRNAKKSADILIYGVVKLKRNPTVYISGMAVNTLSVTNWSIKAIAEHTNEIIFSRNFRPKNHNFNDEDEAVAAVGSLIGDLVAEQLLSHYIATPSKTILFEIRGLTDRRVAKDMKRDLLSARSILNVRFREYLRNTEAVFEVDYAGSIDEFSNFIESELLTGINNKYGQGVFAIDHIGGDRVILVATRKNVVSSETIRSRPPLSLLSGRLARAKSVIKTTATLQRVFEFNNNLPQSLADFEQ